jgi:diguanylate cyclase (GGDEF)-like protein/PAS domain S-box-containing protein
MERVLPIEAVLPDRHLVLLAIIVCLCTSVATFTLFSHVLVRGARAHGWLLLNGFCTGTGLWASSLIMALSPGAPAEGLAEGYVAFAVIIAMGMTMGGLFLASQPRRFMVAGGGAVAGLGLALAHLANMTAFHPETLFWSKGLLALAVILAAGCFGAAFVAFRELVAMRALAVSAGLMTVGSTALFFTMSGAADIATHLVGAPQALPLNEGSMAGTAALATAIVLAAGSIAAMLDGRAIRSTFSRLGELIDGIPDGVVIAKEGKIIGVNVGLVELSGRKERDLVGRSVFGDLLATWRRQGAPGRDVAFETPLLAEGGETIPVRVVRHFLHALGHANEVYSIRDMRERDESKVRIAELAMDLDRTEAGLRQRNFLLDVVLQNMTQGMAMYDRDQRLVLANDRYAEIYGVSPEDIIPGTKLRDVVQKRIDDGLFAGVSAKAYLEERLAPVERETETVHTLNDGRVISISQRPMPGGGWVTTHDDITELRRVEEENRHLAQHDTLTLLPNRTSLRAMLNETLAAAARKRRRLAVLIINLDHFRDINDTLGNRMGDGLLAAMAERLSAFKRRTTLLGRVGDDEFVLVEAVDRPGRDAAALANRVLDHIRKPFTVEGRLVKVGATIGISISPADGEEADLLLRRADMALYRAKQKERGSFAFFEPSMEKHLAEQLSLQDALADALMKGQFELHYQPLVNLVKKEISGFETLLRWNHPARGLILPADFIPAAEAAGMMHAIGEWALRQACREAAQWPAPLKVTHNVSISQFKSPDFAQMVISALASAGLSAQRLEIEVSESVIWENREEALAITKRLAELGVSIALDDFGTRFSSLSQLGAFPFKSVKIDRSFVGAVSGAAESQAMVRTLLRLGASFGAEITAEGVETREQFDFVQREGFTEMQGYYFSPPKTAEEIRRLFLTRQNDSAVA